MFTVRNWYSAYRGNSVICTVPFCICWESPVLHVNCLTSLWLTVSFLRVSASSTCFDKKGWGCETRPEFSICSLGLGLQLLLGWVLKTIRIRMTQTKLLQGCLAASFCEFSHSLFCLLGVWMPTAWNSFPQNWFSIFNNPGEDSKRAQRLLFHFYFSFVFPKISTLPFHPSPLANIYPLDPLLFPTQTVSDPA